MVMRYAERKCRCTTGHTKLSQDEFNKALLRFEENLKDMLIAKAKYAKRFTEQNFSLAEFAKL